MHMSPQFESVSLKISPPRKRIKDTDSLAKIAESDPTFKWEFDPETGETVISGMGTVHLEVMIEKLKNVLNREISFSNMR